MSAGPGHSPVSPQPAPKRAEPIISLASGFADMSGSSNLSLWTGASLFKTSLKDTALKATAERRTKRRVGSHVSLSVRNPNIFVGLHMPLTTRPSPKIIP